MMPIKIRITVNDTVTQDKAPASGRCGAPSPHKKVEGHTQQPHMLDMYYGKPQLGETEVCTRKHNYSVLKIV